MIFNKMIINTCDYNITQNDVHVLTRTNDANYIDTDCYLSNFYIESPSLADILSCFEYKNNFLTKIKQFGRSPVFKPVLRILTNANIQLDNFNVQQDLLAIALFLDHGKNKPAWLDYFEVNRIYRRNVTETQKYKTVGGSMLTALQREYIHQGIEGSSTAAAQDFYLKYGFKRIDKFEIRLRWSPQR